MPGAYLTSIVKLSYLFYHIGVKVRSFNLLYDLLDCFMNSIMFLSNDIILVLFTDHIFYHVLGDYYVCMREIVSVGLLNRVQ